APMRRVSFVGCCATLLLAMEPPAALAQVGGVYVDPQGMLRQTSSLDETRLHSMLRDMAPKVQPSRDVAAAAAVAKLSLRRLAAEVSRLSAAGDPLPSDLRFLAGLTLLKYVFFYPDANDVVLAGPAEAWELLDTGDIVGRQSRRPVLQFDDLIVGLRYAFD